MIRNDQRKQRNDDTPQPEPFSFNTKSPHRKPSPFLQAMNELQDTRDCEVTTCN